MFWGLRGIMTTVFGLIQEQGKGEGTQGIATSASGWGWELDWEHMVWVRVQEQVQVVVEGVVDVEGVVGAVVVVVAVAAVVVNASRPFLGPDSAFTNDASLYGFQIAILALFGVMMISSNRGPSL